MEKSEPTFVPEWLRSAGSVTGGGSSTHHPVLSSLHSDAASSSNHSRKSSKGSGDYDSPRSAFFEQASASNYHWSTSSNGYSRNPYGSFNKNHREKDRDKEREWFIRDNWDRSCSDSATDILGGKIQKDVLMRSCSMASGRQNDSFPQRIKTDSENRSNSSHMNRNGAALGGSVVGSSCKSPFEKDFPSLGPEERIKGISPGFSPAVPNLPEGGWTSALAEALPVLGSNSNGSSSAQSMVVASPAPRNLNTIGGLNMAEALAQAPTRTRVVPQLSVETHRLEELALKQSRQLIPVTPTTSKASALNISDKAKLKTAARAPEMVVAGRSGLQQFSSSSLGSQPPCGARPDASRTSLNGKYCVLKPPWESNGYSTPKDASGSLNNSGNRAFYSHLSASSSERSSSHIKTVERKTAPLALNGSFAIERRPSSTQAQSRNDFFNLMRKKSLGSHPPQIDLGPATDKERSAEEIKMDSIPASHQSVRNGNSCENSGLTEEDSNWSCNAACLEEEEARFLRSLGWEEATDEDEGLTEEEINSFYEACMKLRPSLELRRGVQLRLPMMLETHLTEAGGAGRAV